MDLKSFKSDIGLHKLQAKDQFKEFQALWKPFYYNICIGSTIFSLKVWDTKS